MGRRKQNAPRHGSLAYLPRGRAKRVFGRVRFWPKIISSSPKLLGFSGYKVGMSHHYLISNIRGSPTFGQEINNSVTILETPPMIVCCIRAYSNTAMGLRSIIEIWVKDLPKELKRVFSTPKNVDTESLLKEIEDMLSNISELRVVLITQPHLASISKKTPEFFEVKVDGGNIRDQFVYLKKLLGKEIKISDIFKEGQFVDVIAITKGKGIQGPVKRWGVKTLPHKSRKTVRGIGTLGAWTPHHVMYTVPRAGQMGFYQRTEFNKKIVAIGKNSDAPNPKGGFSKYGLIKTDYMILKGSIPGSTKRFIKIRYASRPSIIEALTETKREAPEAVVT